MWKIIDADIKAIECKAYGYRLASTGDMSRQRMFKSVEGNGHSLRSACYDSSALRNRGRRESPCKSRGSASSYEVENHDMVCIDAWPRVLEVVTVPGKITQVEDDAKAVRSLDLRFGREVLLLSIEQCLRAIPDGASGGRRCSRCMDSSMASQKQETFPGLSKTEKKKKCNGGQNPRYVLELYRQSCDW